MKPIYVFSAAMALLGKMDENRNSISTDNYDKFTAPQARVLVVDDDKLNLNVAVGLLKTFKIEADTALSGEEALKMVDSGKYDIIFLDHILHTSTFFHICVRYIDCIINLMWRFYTIIVSGVYFKIFNLLVIL